ncbi:hypothetical protein CDL15_Pgr028038 [Punica granatum]|uniref:Uncharacterized protein n=1 Tax=Punica granatum TaxID=22663 RepID=A0A218XL97_PUNGR|nr:hypothetical protein CDL15_Pgr028038 [Punica granatum]
MRKTRERIMTKRRDLAEGEEQRKREWRPKRFSKRLDVYEKATEGEVGHGITHTREWNVAKPSEIPVI